ncbi:hypothetical protein [uncultured Maribacter sp.]|uniref:hypothetical protein n=1 Tax=uncultured Maribacter sp. TaxID=431308 RepID=UPI002604BBBC|nr:hypothetical protein [uncultured Maribacter sp.]
MNKILLLLICVISLSCEIENYSYFKPIMITNEPESVLTNSVTLGGRVLGEGGKKVTEYGIVWGEELPLDINLNKVIEGSRIGSFSKNYNFFKANTTYYYAAYGINDEGVSYGEIFDFKTTAEPSCTPLNENYLDFWGFPRNVSYVKSTTNTYFGYGNLAFILDTDRGARMEIAFNEVNGELPLTGEYNTVREFNNQSTKSNGEVRINITDFSYNSIGGGDSNLDQKLYIENKDGVITFIFCDFEFRSNSFINGKFTYLIK